MNILRKRVAAICWAVWFLFLAGASVYCNFSLPARVESGVYPDKDWAAKPNLRENAVVQGADSFMILAKEYCLVTGVSAVDSFGKFNFIGYRSGDPHSIAVYDRDYLITIDRTTGRTYLNHVEVTEWWYDS